MPSFVAVVVVVVVFGSWLFATGAARARHGTGVADLAARQASAVRQAATRIVTPGGDPVGLIYHRLP